MTTKDLRETVFKGMLEKKGESIVLLDFKSIPNAFAQDIIICSGSSTRQVEALADSVELEVKKSSAIQPYRKEGYENKEWIIIDYVEIVVHVFLQEKRAYYNLEDLWGDAKISQVN